MPAADYVIVGAGAGGCVLADQLSATGATVVLLEAGQPDRNINSKIPAAFSKLFKTKHDWDYTTVAQPELKGRELYWPRGKMLGGSTALNAMIYQRGHRHTFDQWAADGNSGWSYGDLLSSFMALEDQERGASDFHGTGGGMTVSDVRSPNELSEAFIEAGVSAGFERNDDFNDDTQDGFGMFQVTQRNGVRCSAATAFLKPAMKRSNLTVITGAQATKVMMCNGRAGGVEWVDKKGMHVTCATEEVILCGGAVNTPQLLMLSGIGPAEHLQSVGISVVHDSPEVGQNLIDHLVCGAVYTIDEPISLAQAEKPKPLFEYATKRTGMLSSNVAESGGFVRLGDGPVPDIQFHFGSAIFLDHGLEPPTEDGFSIGPTLVDVKSRGEIRLGSSNPLAKPIIDPRYLSDPADLGVLVEGCKLARELAEQPSLRKYVTAEQVPGKATQTDAEWVEHVRSMAESLYHPVGTCAMGPSAEAVVDSQLRVNGIDGLRIADASVMPSIVNANTQAISMVIGKRAADFIGAEKA